MKLTTELLRATALYVQEYYNNHFSEQYSFHQYNRTVNIVRNCDALGMRMNLDKQNLKILHLTAWFLELGYCRDYYNYQEHSVQLAREYFKTTAPDDDIMEQIEEAILSTRVPQQPVSAIAQIICDAGMYHLAGKDTFANAELLRAEYAAIVQKEFTDEEWINENIKMISDNFYFTAAAKDVYQKRKDKNLSVFKKKLNKINQKETLEQPGEILTENPEIIIEEEELKLERGVETFFRITERRNMELSKNAHDKASLLISVNAIVISIVLSVLFTKLEDNTYLLFPTLMLVISCTLTIIFAIL